jgi:hypothetical protein
MDGSPVLQTTVIDPADISALQHALETKNVGLLSSFLLHNAGD